MWDVLDHEVPSIVVELSVEQIMIFGVMFNNLKADCEVRRSDSEGFPRMAN